MHPRTARLSLVVGGAPSVSGRGFGFPTCGTRGVDLKRLPTRWRKLQGARQPLRVRVGHPSRGLITAVENRQQQMPGCDLTVPVAIGKRQRVLGHDPASGLGKDAGCLMGRGRTQAACCFDRFADHPEFAV